MGTTRTSVDRVPRSARTATEQDEPSRLGECPRALIVVGLGNEIAGDDAVGILAARHLRNLLDARADVLELPWAGLRLLTALRGYTHAILIDSLQSQRFTPGTVVRLQEQDLAGSVRLNSFHDLNYPTAMALGRRLGWPLPDQVEIYAVEGQVFDRFEQRLSPAVERGLKQVVAWVAARLGAHHAGPPLEQLEVTDGHESHHLAC